MDKVPINPKAREAYEQMKNEMGRELGINDIDKGKLPSRLFSFRNKNSSKPNEES